MRRLTRVDSFWRTIAKSFALQPCGTTLKGDLVFFFFSPHLSVSSGIFILSWFTTTLPMTPLKSWRSFRPTRVEMHRRCFSNAKSSPASHLLFLFQARRHSERFSTSLARAAPEGAICSTGAIVSSFCSSLCSLKTGSLSTEYYFENELQIGTTLNVFGRAVILCDCDEFTKTFYNVKYGITDFSSIPIPKVCFFLMFHSLNRAV
jgi:hypothetical protein